MPPTSPPMTAHPAKAAAAVAAIGRGGLVGCRALVAPPAAERHRCRSQRKAHGWWARGKEWGGHLRTPTPAVSAITAVAALVVEAAAQAYGGSGGAGRPGAGGVRPTAPGSFRGSSRVLPPLRWGCRMVAMAVAAMVGINPDGVWVAAGEAPRACALHCGSAGGGGRGSGSRR